MIRKAASKLIYYAACFQQKTKGEMLWGHKEFGKNKQDGLCEIIFLVDAFTKRFIRAI